MDNHSATLLPTAETARQCHLLCRLSLAERHNDHVICLPASPQDMEAVAKFDFVASGEDELSFHAGDVLKVGDVGPQQSSREGAEVPESSH